MRIFGISIATVWFLAGCGLLAGPARAADERQGPEPPPLRIGMLCNFFRTTPQPLARALMEPFGKLLEVQTGLRGQLILVQDGKTLGDMLAKDQVDCAVFQGFEFAWARQHHHDLQPLAIAVNQDCHLYACLVVHTNSIAGSLTDLKGQKLAFPKGSREHAHLYLNRACRKLGGQAPAQFFAQICSSRGSEAALDDVVDGAVPAALVDGVALPCYKRRKPERFEQIKVLEQSEVFPASVIACRQGHLDAATVKLLRKGMIRANQVPLGKQLLTLWKLTAFEAVPADYEDTLRDILKAYPGPEGNLQTEAVFQVSQDKK